MIYIYIHIYIYMSHTHTYIYICISYIYIHIVYIYIIIIVIIIITMYIHIHHQSPAVDFFAISDLDSLGNDQVSEGGWEPQHFLGPFTFWSWGFSWE